jgi:hypothetical protein
MDYMGQDPSMDEVRAQWADVLAGQDEVLANQMTGISADESRNARRASEINAAMGGSVGGGFQGGQIQAQLSGSVARSQAQAEHGIRQMELKMTFLQRMLDAAEAQKDRESAERIKEEMGNIAIQIQQMIGGQQMDLLEAGLETGEGGGPGGDVPGATGGVAEDVRTADQEQIGDPEHEGYDNWDERSAEDWRSAIQEKQRWDGDQMGNFNTELNDYLSEMKHSYGLNDAELLEAERLFLWYYYKTGDWKKQSLVRDMIRPYDPQNPPNPGTTGPSDW